MFLEQMHYVMGLLPGELPYEEYISCAKELEILKKNESNHYMTYWEVMCHYLICMDTRGTRHRGMSFPNWAGYLFPSGKTGSKTFELHGIMQDDVVQARILRYKGSITYICDEDDGGFYCNTEFSNYHWQERPPISNKAFVTSFLMIWLKRCILPSPPNEVIQMEAIWPAVCLAFGKPLALVPTMVANIQRRPRRLTSEFCAYVQDGRTPNLWVEVAYTYLVTWFVLHCYTLMMTTGRADLTTPFIERLAECTWRRQYLFNVWKAVRQESSYIICARHPVFSPAMYNKMLRDSRGEDGYTLLLAETFSWLVSIQLSYLIYWLIGECII